MRRHSGTATRAELEWERTFSMRIPLNSRRRLSVRKPGRGLSAAVRKEAPDACSVNLEGLEGRLVVRCSGINTACWGSQLSVENEPTGSSFGGIQDTSAGQFS